MTHKTQRRAVLLSSLWTILLTVPALAGLEQQASAVQKAEKGMTLWQMIHAGGGTMFLLALLSMVLVAFVAYFFIYYKKERLVPEEFSRNVLEKLASRRYSQAKETCVAQDNLLGRIVIAGLDRQSRGPAAMREAAELTAKNEVTKLWESLSYLSDIAVVAPLVGLLGTVLGMIDSFNVIAFSSASAKPVLLAGGIAKAMVATAGGLVIAIPASVFYSFFRSRVFKITAKVESFTSEAVDLLEGRERVAEKTAHV